MFLFYCYFFKERKFLFAFDYLCILHPVNGLKHLIVNRASLQQQSEKKQTCGCLRLKVLVPTGSLFVLSSHFIPVHIGTGFTAGFLVSLFFFGHFFI